jgi:NAD/NADP transhydrogenase alpha subunit
MPLGVGVKRETNPGKHRVALVHDGAARLIQSGLAVLIEGGVGDSAEFSDTA